MNTTRLKRQFHDTYRYNNVHEHPIVVPPDSPLIIPYNIKPFQGMLYMHLEDESIIQNYFPNAKIFIYNPTPQKLWLFRRFAQACFSKSRRLRTYDDYDYMPPDTPFKFIPDDIASIYAIKYCREDGNFRLLGRTRTNNLYFELFARQTFVDSIYDGSIELHLYPLAVTMARILLRSTPLDIDLSALRNSPDEINLYIQIVNNDKTTTRTTANRKRNSSSKFSRRKDLKRKYNDYDERENIYYATSRVFSYDKDDGNPVIELCANLTINGLFIKDEEYAQHALRHIGRALQCLHTAKHDRSVILPILTSNNFNAIEEEEVEKRRCFLQRVFSTTTFVNKVDEVHFIKYANELDFHLVGRLTMDGVSYPFKLLVEGKSDGVIKWTINQAYILLLEENDIINSLVH